MKKLIRVIVVLALLLIGLGFYRGWFAVSNPGPDTGSSKMNLNLTVDPDKMKEDVETVKKKTTDLKDNVTGEKSPPTITPPPT
jgi:hypothetical protein